MYDDWDDPRNYDPNAPIEPPPPAQTGFGSPGYDGPQGPFVNGYDPGPNWNGGVAPSIPDGRYDYNNGSPVNSPLTPGYGWEWRDAFGSVDHAPVWDSGTNQWNYGSWNQVKDSGIGRSPTPSGPGPGPGPSPGGAGSGGFGYLTEPFTGHAPSWNAWSPTAAPQIVRPPDFSYEKFVAPTKDSIYSDPSYLFRKGEGEQALSNRIASTGAYRTGGTLKDFINYNQNAASQEYSNIFDRAVTAHNLGLQQALGTYGTNWGVSRDVLDRNMDQWKATNTWSQRENENTNNRDMDAFLADYDIFNSNRKRAGDYLFRAAELGG